MIWGLFVVLDFLYYYFFLLVCRIENWLFNMFLMIVLGVKLLISKGLLL